MMVFELLTTENTRNSVLTCFNQKIEVILPPLENYEVKKKQTHPQFAL